MASLINQKVKLLQYWRKMKYEEAKYVRLCVLRDTIVLSNPFLHLPSLVSIWFHLCMKRNKIMSATRRCRLLRGIVLVVC